MKKFWVLSFSLAVMGATAYGLARPSFEMQNLLEFSDSFVMVRILMVLLLVSYVFIERVRVSGSRMLMTVFSLSMIGVGIAAIVSPTLFGYFNNYLPIGDTVIFLEGGIIGALLAFELPLHQSIFGHSYASKLYRLNRTAPSRS